MQFFINTLAQGEKVQSSKVSCLQEGYHAILQSSFKTLTSRSEDYAQATAPQHQTIMPPYAWRGSGWEGGNKEVQTSHLPYLAFLAVLPLSPCLPLLCPFSSAKVLINYKYALLDNFLLFLLLPNLLELPPPALYSPPRHPSPFPYSSGFPPCLPACALPHASKHSY